MNAADFNRAAAIATIENFMAGAPASGLDFRSWLESLTDDQLAHYHAEITEGAAV